MYKNGIKKRRKNWYRKAEEANGIKESQIKVAKELLKMEMSIDDISKATKLTKEEIESLK